MNGVQDIAAQRNIMNQFQKQMDTLDVNQKVNLYKLDHEPDGP
jgi:hypothetical protein